MRLLLSFVFAAFVLTACNNDQQTDNKAAETPAPAATPVSKLNDAGTSKLMQMLSDYYSLKNSFVASDGTEASVAAEKLAMSATDFQVEVVKDSSNHLALKPSLDTITNEAMAISKTSPAELEIMRASFEKVSDNMFALLRQADLQHANVYRQYCPMAFDDKGAYWLSSEEEIRNPYYGKKMLECGEVTDSLK